MKLTFAELGKKDEEGGLPGPESKPGESTDSGSTGKRRGRPPGSTSQARLTELEVKLREKLLEDMVVPLTLASPLAAANLEARAERTAKAAVRLAAKNPSVRKGIERFIDGSDVFTVAMFPLTTAICFMVDWGMMNPNALPARAAGVPAYWEEVYGEGNQQEGTESGTDFFGMNGHAEPARGLLGEVG